MKKTFGSKKKLKEIKDSLSPEQDPIDPMPEKTEQPPFPSLPPIDPEEFKMAVEGILGVVANFTKTKEPPTEKEIEYFQPIAQGLALKYAPNVATKFSLETLGVLGIGFFIIRRIFGKDKIQEESPKPSEESPKPESGQSQ